MKPDKIPPDKDATLGIYYLLFKHYGTSMEPLCVNDFNILGTTLF
ncbi:hypothetical protein BRE01_66800 [Brevibacillus reuszeri]|uniref:Uncharacterized protein n=1 Tax=Brevibacillus reuszeri TaxID=54915 RepID=A0ABQ0U2I1_9BACL|nr:hypothetical protein BRE01_66800 [Brevibacillus reuszeri]